MDEKPAKTFIYMRRSFKNVFESQKVIHLTQRIIEKVLSVGKNRFTMTAFLTFAFMSKCRVRTERKPILLFESLKIQEKANNSLSYRFAAIKSNK